MLWPEHKQEPASGASWVFFFTLSNVKSGPACLLGNNPHGAALPTCTDSCQSQEDRTVLALKLFQYFKELENEIFF